MSASQNGGMGLNPSHAKNKRHPRGSRLSSFLGHGRPSLDEEISIGNPPRQNHKFQTLGGTKPVKVNTKIFIDVEEVMKVACQHEKFSLAELGDGSIEDLPTLDSVSMYDVEPEIEKKLWREEVERLAGVVTNLDSVPHLEGKGKLGQATKVSYETLALLADKIWRGMSLCYHDNQSIFLEHCPKLHDNDGFTSSKDTLSRLTDTDSDNTPHSNVLEKEVTPEEFILFLNYVTSVITRIMCTSAYGNHYHNNVLATIAKFTTKIKIVSVNSTNFLDFAERSLDAAYSAPIVAVADGQEAQMPTGTDRQGPLKELEGILGNMNMQNSRSSPISESTPATQEYLLRISYFHQLSKFQSGVRSLFRYLILSLRGTNRIVTTLNTCFELCSIVYDTGFTRFPTLIFQDREEDFLATSDLDVVNVAHSVFSLLNKSVQHIKTKGRPNIPCADCVPTNISWYYQVEQQTNRPSSSTVKASSHTEFPAGPKDGQMSLKYLNEIIMIMVPLQLTSPVAAQLLQAYVRMIIFTTSQFDRTDPKKSVLPYEQSKFKAFFCLNTEEYQISSGVREELGVSSLSRALMTRDKLLAGRRIGEIPVGTTTYGMTALNISEQQRQTENEQKKQRQLELEAADKEMGKWIFEEKGVMVKCSFYVWSVALICATLVLGGIAVGVTAHDRIPAVDPFNVTTYCWVMAAFILLVAKSVRVEQWPWRDFLLRRVFCRSISELHAVTRIDEQLILAKLLHDESTTLLATRGPYNTPFQRKSDDGFSIDRPLSMWTMLLSGLIMLQAQTDRGWALICLDVRKGTEYALVSQENMPTEEQSYIVCDWNALRDGVAKGGSKPELRLKRTALGWHRIVGLYNVHNTVFV